MHDGSLFLASNLYSACLCGFENAAINQCLNECKYMKHIFELRMKDQIEERSSQLLRNLSSCEKKA